MRTILVMALGGISCFPFAVNAGDYFVATDGANSNPGSLAAPWQSIQFAVEQAGPGDTVYVRAGSYNEQVRFVTSGSEKEGHIALTAYQNEAVILDGEALTPSAGQTAMIRLENVSYITVKGLEVKNFRTSDNNAVPIGIFITGNASDIQLLNNHVHHIEQNTDSKNGDAHAIAVYGSDGNNAISGLLIRGNTVNDCKLGSSEAIVLNGNVDQFTVKGNRVYNCNNIGIDLIGWEGVAPANDQARSGTVCDNTVYNITSYGNPAYGTERSAAGIYVDGGKDIIIERNRVYQCDFGIEVASEHQGKTTTGITVRNNLIYANLVAGITFGGYASDRGVALNCSFEHNTLFNNDTTGSGNGEIMIQKANNNTLKNNIIYCSSQNIAVSNYFSAGDTFDNKYDYNIYYTAGDTAALTFIRQNKEYNGFSNYQQNTGQDQASTVADPAFVSTVEPYDFHLQAESPAINAGDPAFVPGSGETDFDGNTRIQGGRTDGGAYEYNSGGVVTYLLTVNNGSGSGSYSAGERVVINADSAPSGQQFLQWTGDVAYLDDPAAASTTVTMPAANVSVTATYSSSNTFALAWGSILEVKSTDLDEALQQFSKKPKLYATWNDSENATPLKVITKVTKKSPQAAVYALLKKSVRLYDKGDYKSSLLSRALAQQPINSQPLDGIFINYYDRAGDIDITDKKLAVKAELAVPIISAVSGEFSRTGDRFTITGFYFGTKAPAVYIEMLKNGDSGKPRYKKCKLIKDKTYIYLDAKRKAAKSCMKIYIDDPTDNNAVGFSTVTVEYPKFSAKDTTTGYLILDNKTALKTYQLSK